MHHLGQLIISFGCWTLLQDYDLEQENPVFSVVLHAESLINARELGIALCFAVDVRLIIVSCLDLP